jgi:protein TonB
VLPAAPFLGKSHLRERVDLLLKEVFMSRVRTQIHVGISAAAILLAAGWAVSAAPLQSVPNLAPAAPAGEAARISTSDAGPDAAPPQIVRKVNPAYPEAAKAEKVEGTFQLALVVGKDGVVRDARVVASSSTPGKLEDETALQGDARLAEAAVAAVKQWRYRPVEKNGQPVEVRMTVTVVFRL